MLSLSHKHFLNTHLLSQNWDGRHISLTKKVIVDLCIRPKKTCSFTAAVTICDTLDSGDNLVSVNDWERRQKSSCAINDYISCPALVFTNDTQDLLCLGEQWCELNRRRQQDNYTPWSCPVVNCVVHWYAPMVFPHIYVWHFTFKI